MIAFVYALPEESRGLVGALADRARIGCSRDFLGRLGDREVVVLHTGMGVARARERFARLRNEHGKIRCVISAGYAGGLDPSLASGALLLGENYSDPRLLGIARQTLGNRCRVGALATSKAMLETCAAKAEVAKQTGALAVEMETAAIAEICREANLPLLSVRVISDTAGEELAVPFSVCFDSVRERPRTAALLGFLLAHPSRIPGFTRFVLTVSRAQRVLTAALLELAGAV